eukprot:5462053-Prymnesium_polylepis.1
MMIGVALAQRGWVVGVCAAVGAVGRWCAQDGLQEGVQGVAEGGERAGASSACGARGGGRAHLELVQHMLATRLAVEAHGVWHVLRAEGATIAHLLSDVAA